VIYIPMSVQGFPIHFVGGGALRIELVVLVIYPSCAHYIH
jgi:hypothetical protein